MVSVCLSYLRFTVAVIAVLQHGVVLLKYTGKLWQKGRRWRRMASLIDDDWWCVTEISASCKPRIHQQSTTGHPTMPILLQFNPLSPTVAIWGTARLQQHPVPHRVKPSFVIFDGRALWRSGLSKITMTALPGLAVHRMLYRCTHMVTVGN